MPNDRKDRVFLSYASEDLDRVRQVYDGLIKRGLDVWFDKVDLKGGKWKRQIRKAIISSRHFVICISEAALKKTGDDTQGFQDEELDYAYSIAQDQPEDKFIIYPVRIEECGRGDFRLSGWQQFDLFEDFEKVLDKLAVDMGGVSLSDATTKDERTDDEKLIDSLFAKAEAAFYAFKFDESIYLFNSILVLTPNNVDVLIFKGAALQRLGRYDEALYTFDKALQIDSNVASSYYNKGTVLGIIGRGEEAVEAFNKALQIDPNDARAWHNKGIALLSSGRKETALDAFNKALELDSNLEVALEYKNELIKMLKDKD